MGWNIYGTALRRNSAKVLVTKILQQEGRNNRRLGKIDKRYNKQKGALQNCKITEHPRKGFHQNDINQK